jgi:uncharacterized protein YjiK
MAKHDPGLKNLA